jgi:hypothetical protein
MRVGDLIIDYLNGYALGARSGRLGQPGERAEVRQLLAQSPGEAYPTLRRIFSTLGDDEMSADTDASLNLLLAGIGALTSG